MRVVERLADGSVRLSNGSLLTGREVEILKLMAEGLRNREIAARLYISVHTVEYNATRIFGKLGVRNRTEAGLLAVQIQVGDSLASVGLADAVSMPPELGEAKMLPHLSRSILDRRRGDHMVKKVSNKLGRLGIHTRIGLLMAALLVTSATFAGAAAFNDRVFGYSTYHCTNTTPMPTREAAGFATVVPPTPERVAVVGTDKTTLAEPGSICAETEADLLEYFGRDEESRYCVHTEPPPTSIRSIKLIRFGEPVPPTGAKCFQDFEQVLQFFRIDPESPGPPRR